MTFVKETPAGRSDDQDVLDGLDESLRAGAASTAAYPVPRPSRGGDARFTYGLALDVGAILARYGYPEVRVGADLVRVQQALFGLIYGRSDEPALRRMTSHLSCLLPPRAGCSPRMELPERWVTGAMPA
jgi:hypothetical protein